MKNISLFFFLIIVAAITSGCNSEKAADSPTSVQSNDIGKLSKSNSAQLQKELALARSSRQIPSNRKGHRGWLCGH